MTQLSFTRMKVRSSTKIKPGIIMLILHLIASLPYTVKELLKEDVIETITSEASARMQMP